MKEDHDMKDIYERYAKKVQQENDLIHHRMVWFVTLQSFLFTSLALFTNGTFFGDLRGWICRDRRGFSGLYTDKCCICLRRNAGYPRSMA